MKRSQTNNDVVGLLVRQMEREGLPQAVREHRFHPVRKWRFDLAYPDWLIAFEYEGAIFAGGRHTRGAGYAKDIEKYNTAGLMGWRVFRLYGDMIFKGNREMDEGWKLIKEVVDICRTPRVFIDADSLESTKDEAAKPIQDWGEIIGGEFKSPPST